ncbi:MAG: IclR family transcriptional regulator [Chloroflexota bacterium]
MSEIQSVKRAFTILKTVAGYPYGITLAELTPKVDLPKSTVARMLSTLETIEAIERAPDGNGFRLGPETTALALQPHYLITALRPYLEQLAEATGETVALVLPDNNQIHYVDQIESRYNIQMRDFTGYRISVLHAHSPGKLMLADKSAKQLADYLSQPLEQFTPQTLVDPTFLKQQIDNVRQQGYAIACDESEPGLVGIAAPLHNQARQLLAIINIYGPAFRFPPIEPDSELITLLLDTARKISSDLYRVS